MKYIWRFTEAVPKKHCFYARKTTVFNFVKQNNSPAFCIQTAQIRRPARTLPYSVYCISDDIFGCMDSLSYRQIRYLYRKIELVGEELYGACNISDTRVEIPNTNILHAPHFGFSGPRLTDLNLLFVCFGATAPQRARASSFTRFLDHTQRRTIVSRTPLDEWSARRRDLYLTTHNTHNRQTSMPLVGLNPQSQQASGRRPAILIYW